MAERLARTIADSSGPGDADGRSGWGVGVGWFAAYAVVMAVTAWAALM